MTNKFIKYTEGEIIGNWVIVKNLGVKNRITKYLVHCNCGNESEKSGSQIRNTTCCYKCARKQQTENGGPRRTHGACSTDSKIYTTYMAWTYMKKRCQGKTDKDRKNYVERKITVCLEWEKSFENFLEDMGPKPPNSSLDRIDNNKGYFKENCRWTSTKIQNNNKRGCIYFEYNGEKLTIAQWAEKFNITRSKASEWIKREGIEWVYNNLETIKKCKTGMSHREYEKLGLGKRKGSGQRKHAASRDKNHPLHTMYKSWDYIKRHEDGMSEDWKDFMNFVNSMGIKPFRHRLCRKNLHKPFSKENCYWEELN